MKNKNLENIFLDNLICFINNNQKTLDINFIEILNNQIKILKLQNSILELNKPYFFQNKKKKEFLNNIKTNQELIFSYQKIIKEIFLNTYR